jgi:hypothetical protein
MDKVMEVTESKLLSEILLQFHRRARNGYPFVTPHLTDLSHISNKKNLLIILLTECTVPLIKKNIVYPNEFTPTKQ